MNELGIVGILFGALALFFMGKQHEKTKVAKLTALQIVEKKNKEQEIKNEVNNSDLEHLVASNNEHLKSK